MQTQEMMRAIAQHRCGSADTLGMTNADMPLTTATSRDWRHSWRQVMRRQQFAAAAASMGDRLPWLTSKQARFSGKPVIVEGT